MNGRPNLKLSRTHHQFLCTPSNRGIQEHRIWVPSTDLTTFHPLDSATNTVALKKAIRLLEGAYHQLSAILAPPQHTVMNMFWINIQMVLARSGWPKQSTSASARLHASYEPYPSWAALKKEVFANTRLSLILKSTNNIGCFAGLHSQDVVKYAGVLYESMIDKEFSRSHEPDKALWVLAFWKEGMKVNY
ncbi:uncharacterized protein BJ212DRAFT_926350 [Suillus subaureus]|uniref:Uncharacterized protein n=1 Tax=Suillus subaureus TaxID=48587 RepID=A0A9P7EHY7_9AGAM|nr:uncharacterized protein BJ212DRAFT_926350 [Suillus subaureus]KAG1821849.1 hypothetical protein BJ212DRAFT_926350 [Suillus subaureus]